MKYTVAVLVLLASAAFYYFFKQQDCDLVLRYYQSFGPEPCSRLRGKVVWITGASSGIGEQLAYDLAACGCRLILSARREHKLEQVKEKCSSIALKQNPSFEKNDDILVLPLDVTSFSSHANLSRHVMEKFGQVDILVNNAGVVQMPQIPFEVEKQLLDINLLGAISLSKAVLPYMKTRKEGQIVVVSSVTGKYVVPGFAAYCASKFGLQAYFDSLRYELSSQNITVVTVHPGPVVSDALSSALSNVLNVTAKDIPDYQAFVGTFKHFTFMATERFTYLMRVAMVNNLKESWISTREALNIVYRAHYLHAI